VDRILASQMGKTAVDCVLSGIRNVMVAGKVEKVYTIPLTEVIKGQKTPELDMLELARMLSI
jgi:6-phosphofructokinase 1